MTKYIHTAKNMRCGLIGEKLSHSISPQIHALLSPYAYGLYELESDKLGEFFEKNELDAFNVTIPYKRAVLPYLSKISDEARKIGAVNTVIRQSDGSFFGDNTDYYGFKKTLDFYGIDVKDKKVLVLGSGGAAASVKAVLSDGGGKVFTVSRSGELNYENVDSLHHDADIIVNATPVGMYPDVNKSPIELSSFTALQSVIDLIYNPARTMLLIDAEKRGIKAVNGLYMLVAQAKRACELFTGETLDDAVICEITSKLNYTNQNIILIGMPSCGKSTVGKLVAESLGRKFIDTDAFVPEYSKGFSPAECIEKLGVPEFRRIESEIVKRFGKESGLVIATGGGVPTVYENYAPLHANGIMIRIDRPLSELSVDGRPLSQGVFLDTLYRERLPFYEAFEDGKVQSQSTPESTAKAVIEEFIRIIGKENV